MMKARIAELIGIGVIAAATVVPAPKITVHSPRVLYTLAIYKAAMGDTTTALHLLREAESNSQQVHATTARAAGKNCPETL